MVRALILAAGASSRMGRAKAGLAVDDRGETFLSRLVRTAAEASVPDIVVVTGASRAIVPPWLPRSLRQLRVVHNENWQSGQLSSLLTGLDAPSTVPIEAIAVMLVDVPLVSAATVRTLVEVWRRSRAPIVRPARGDVHGHPVIFGGRLFDALRQADLSKGAKTVVRAHEHDIVNVALDDDGAFRDFDTPEVYDAWRSRS